MIIYPAIDIRNSKCVRLYQGDFNRETIYSVDPISTAKKFAVDGAEWIHIVDLSGADDPDNNQLSLISTIITETNIKVQTGGGIRDKTQVEALLKIGAARVIVGSMAVQQPNEVSTWLNEFGADRIVLALDVIFNSSNQPMITTNAWKDISVQSLFDMIRFYERFGLKHVLCTNISLDGTLSGPDCNLYKQLLDKFPFLCLQASGGIRSLDDIKSLKNQGLSGAIVGRALYENKLELPEVLAC
ncbi:MAG: 1-(5-phosphoribosyl)-5-[(5-phosphoribosylamino)methylideneamino]imidazole-4-carboxamide isomerase [Gammaproteobacteria bacterium]|nr:1-(5-phosphoribosyl)-5-[(5-phosphoribosylamino)methylideneamino]imidazole-4-carboxamide isomerase [Gammaproteobacteria bacterium]